MAKLFAHHISSGQASKHGGFKDASNMENALMQEPSHMFILIYMFKNYSIIWIIRKFLLIRFNTALRQDFDGKGFNQLN